MTDTPNIARLVERLMKSANPVEQERLKAQIGVLSEHHSHLLAAYLANPFLRLTEQEVAHLRNGGVSEPLANLIAARQAATTLEARRVSVFCMPKSGSSFVSAALQRAFRTPFVSMTSVGRPDLTSYFGMNSREQEMDELAIMKAVLSSPNGFVSQNHTRYSVYLALQLQMYRIAPIVTVRNILDCIVSFDEMMCSWRGAGGGRNWVSDAQFVLPLDYTSLAPERRYRLLAHSYGVWLVGFYLSWVRGKGQTFVDPLLMKYEEDIVDTERFVELMRTRLGLSAEELDRLSSYARNPDRERSRLNVGVKGRGREKIPDDVKDFLADHISLFAEEISADEMHYLIA